jgi:TetR/AcrR family transcriptional repressor of nem operon
MTRYESRQKEDTRKRILAAASRLFRERGIRATTVPDIMQECGLTVGGFYKHFDSKEDLFRAAMREAIADMQRSFAGMDPNLRGEAWRSVVARWYLSESHRDNRGAGCVLAALGGDIQRTDEDTRRWFQEGLDQMIDLFAERMEGATPATRRVQACQFLAGLVGGLLMSRSVADPAPSREILDACRGVQDAGSSRTETTPLRAPVPAGRMEGEAT